MCLASSTEATRECEQDTLSVPQFPQLQPRGNQRTCPTGPSRGPNDAEDREKARLETGARYSLSALGPRSERGTLPRGSPVLPSSSKSE